jgi:hypothetical protein
MVYDRLPTLGADVRHGMAAFSPLAFGRKARIDPPAKAAGEGVRAIAVPAELERHTGAGVLVGSSAIGDEVAIARELIQVTIELVGRDAEGIRDGDVDLIPRRGRDDVQHQRLASFDTLLRLSRADAEWLAHAPTILKRA